MKTYWMFLLLIGSHAAIAQTTAPSAAGPATLPADLKSLADASAPVAQKASATALVAARRDEYLQSKGLHLGTDNPSNAYIGFASDPVMAKTTDPSWPKSRDRKSTRLNSSHVAISYAVFCL